MNIPKKNNRERELSESANIVTPEATVSGHRSRLSITRSTLLKFWNQYFKLWNLSDLILLGGIFSLGVLILILHLLTWGALVREESGRLEVTEATVLECYLHSRENSKGELMYRPEILISYEVRGEPHLMRTYDRRTLTPDEGFVYDRTTAESILHTFSQGMKCRCWYSANNADRVILHKDPNYWGWIFLVIPTVLISFGAIGLALKARWHKQSIERRAIELRPSSRYPTVPDSLHINESPGTQLAFRLPMSIFPTFRLISLVLLALLWNIPSWTIGIYLFSGTKTLGDTANAVLFGLIFCGGGLWFIPKIWKLVRCAFVFGATILEISDHPIIPSRKHRLSLIQNGPLQANSCDVSIVCEELARYQQGTDTIANNKEVYRQQLYWKEGINIPTAQVLNEEFFLKLPIGVMHTFRTEHNEIIWRLVITIVIDNDSVVERECTVIVLPYTIRSDIYAEGV